MSKTSLVLFEGEELLAVVEGEMWATGANAMANFGAQIRKTFFGIFGYKNVAQLCITTRRIVIEQHESCTCTDISSNFITLLPQSIASVNSASIGTCCCGLCCKKYEMYIVLNSGASYGFVLKGGPQEITKTMELVMNVVAKK